MPDIDSKRLPWKVAGRLVVWGSIVAALVPLIFMLITSIKPAGDTQTIPPKWVFVPTLEHYEAVFGGQTSSSRLSCRCYGIVLSLRCVPPRSPFWSGSRRHTRWLGCDLREDIS